MGGIIGLLLVNCSAGEEYRGGTYNNISICILDVRKCHNGCPDSICRKKFNIV